MDTIELRVGINTDPAKLATNLKFKLDNSDVIRLVAIGNAVTVCTKSIGLLKKFNPNSKYSFDIDSYFDESCGRNITEIYVFKLENTNSFVTETLYCDGLETYRMQPLINKYIAQGYRCVNSLPIVKDGSTVCIKFIFTKED